jgi:hypothetical protein
VTGAPFPLNYLTAQVGSFSMSSGTDECSTDEYSTDCRHCYGNGAQGCDPLAAPLPNDPVPDAPNLRCWNQKKRFGVDMLFPLQRYVDGLSKSKVYDRNGFLVQNPLFDDLPFQRAQQQGAPLQRPRIARSPGLVYLVNIVGVPWQDLARNPKNLAEGYKPSSEINWDLILGNPFAIEASQRKQPTDPVMREDKFARNGTHPITGEEIGPDKWNSVNGREWNTQGQDLQYACIFELDTPRDCSDSTSSCDCSGNLDAQKNPLCETAPDSGTFSTVQGRAKAYPGTRHLAVARGLGSSAVVGSICAPNLKDPQAADFGYRPAINAFVDAAAARLEK